MPGLVLPPHIQRLRDEWNRRFASVVRQQSAPYFNLVVHDRVRREQTARAWEKEADMMIQVGFVAYGALLRDMASRVRVVTA